MIIGFGFGNPLTSLLMLIVTSLGSYLIYRLVVKSRVRQNQFSRAELRQYYYEQRRRARELVEQFDLTDDEIERRIDETLQKSGQSD